MRVRLCRDPAAFLSVADGFLQVDPFSTSVIGVVTRRCLSSGERPGSGGLWAVVEDDGGDCCGLAMHTPPHPLFLSRMPQVAAAALADALADGGVTLAGVNGAAESTTAFAQAWARRTGRSSTPVTAMRMYRLGLLTCPSRVSGRAGLARDPDDVDQVARWLAAFHDEAVPLHPTEDWLAFAQRRVAAGQVHLWHDHGRPVSLAAVSAPVAGVVRVGPVYTPGSLRRKGYGAAVTAAASAAVLAAGAEHVVLYADLANPTSNSIYQAIGYRPDHDAEERILH
ncbi:MAG TPA: GNAT family N-acetyltransferase [Solirubrobacteraceae bacterium]|nr:GNAT family N-acetyltransferase [Solirubrobacteraceae bacterium]